jgi:hypothetical protein
MTFRPVSQIASLSGTAFEASSSPQSICIHSLVETIPEGCFGDCSRLSDVTLKLQSNAKKTIVIEDVPPEKRENRLDEILLVACLDWQRDGDDWTEPWQRTTSLGGTQITASFKQSANASDSILENFGRRFKCE